MMKIYKIFRNASKLMLSKRGFIFIETMSHNIFFENEENIIGKFYDISIHNNEIWTYDNNKFISIVYDLVDFSIIHQYEFPISLRQDICRDEIHNCIFGQVDIDEKQFWVLIDVNKKSIEKRYSIEYGLNGIWKILSNETFLSRKKNILTCHPLSSGEEKWRIDLNALLDTERATVYGDIFEHQGRLFFFISDAQAFIGATFCVSLETGEVIQKLDTYKGWLHWANERFYIIDRTKISILNPDTYEIEYIDIASILRENDWIIVKDKFVVKSNYLYFTTRNLTSHPTPFVGIIDMQERKLIWSQAINVAEGWQNVSELRVQDNRLYVLTDDNTLHIFEEEV